MKGRGGGERSEAQDALLPTQAQRSPVVALMEAPARAHGRAVVVVVVPRGARSCPVASSSSYSSRGVVAA